MNEEGRGPAWANSLFEDNAEFGLGYRLSLDKHREQAAELLDALEPQLGAARVAEHPARAARSRRTTSTRSGSGWRDSTRAGTPGRPARRRICARSTTHLVRRSVWIVGGDGWAYDIGYGGLDHVLASGRNVNILVLDTEVYSNTGGQASKSTPRGAVAKFAAGGKRGRKKDLGLMAVAYGNVYVAQIAMGASAQQTVDAFLEAEAHEGPSLIIAYSHCIAHGINMRFGMRQQKLAVECGHWPLYRYRPAGAGRRHEEFVLDSSAPVDPAEARTPTTRSATRCSPTRTRGGAAPACRGAGGRRPALAGLHEHGRALAGGQPARPRGTWQPRPGGGGDRHEPHHSLHGSDAEEPDGGLGVAAVTEPRHDPPARGSAARRRS